MAVEFNKLQFTKDWNNPTDFPTYQENEQKVRADMQALHDETKEFINETLIPGIENMAVPGTGDMKTEVYDQQGKHTDVFKYAEDTVSEAIKTHLDEASHVDAYSKEETLSAETREMLGLADDAAPKDAFEKIASTPDVVMDASTGKKYTVKIGVGGFGLVPVASMNGLGKYITGLSSAGASVVSVSDSVLAIVGHTSAYINVNQYSYAMQLEVYDRETNEMVYTGGLDSSTSAGLSGAVGAGSRMRSILPDEKSVCCYRLYGFLYDTVSKKSIGGSGIYAVICRDNWLAYYTGNGSSANQNSIYVINRTENTTKSYPISQGISSYSTMHFIGFTGDDLYMIDGDKRLMCVNCKTGAVTLNIKTFNTNLFPVVDSVSFSEVYPVLTTEKYSFFVVRGIKNVSGTNTSFFKTKLLRFDLSDMSDNSGELASLGYEMTGETVIEDIDCTYYMGSIGSKAYFLKNSRVTILDTEANEVEWYTLADDGTTTAKGQGSRQEVQFAIPELPGVILCGTLMLNTKDGTVANIPATEKIDAQYGAVYRGTVTNTDVVGMYTLNTLVGGSTTYKAEKFEEYAE